MMPVELHHGQQSPTNARSWVYSKNIYSWGDYMESPYVGEARDRHGAYVTEAKIWILESNHRRKSHVWGQIRTKQDV